MAAVIDVESKKKSLDIKSFIFWLIIIVAIILPVVFFVSKKQADKQQFVSSEMFELVFDELKEFDGLNITSKGNEVDAILIKLDEVINTYPNTISAKRAEFYKGYVCYYAGKNEQAETIFKNFVLKNKKTFLTPKAYYFLSFVYSDLDKNNESIKSLEYIINEIKDSYYAPLAYFRLGQLFDLSNDKDNALKNYTILIEKYPNSSQVNLAKERISLLKNDIKTFN